MRATDTGQALNHVCEIGSVTLLPAPTMRPMSNHLHAPRASPMEAIAKHRKQCDMPTLAPTLMTDPHFRSPFSLITLCRSRSQFGEDEMKASRISTQQRVADPG